MFDYENFISNIFLTSKADFEHKALELFTYQYSQNEVYHTFCNQLNKTPKKVERLSEIPFLPIEFFKWRTIKTGKWKTEKTFKSSGTTGSERSHHHVRNLRFYHQIATTIFEAQFGKLEDWTIFALLPSYQEQGDSSLISMVDSFMSQAKPASSYYLYQNERLIKDIQSTSGKKLIFGVSYALLELAEAHSLNIDNLIVMETGGMKGRRKEMIREELHEAIKEGVQVGEIYSEYGMSELTSQAYGKNGTFKFPEWCSVMIRDMNDPFSYLKNDNIGGLNIIDLGNVNSCAFIATQDLGKSKESGTFEVLGRFDNSDIRGCNLLV